MRITTSFCAEEELINKIRQQAEKENRNFSNLIETALVYYMNHYNKDIEGENTFYTLKNGEFVKAEENKQ